MRGPGGIASARARIHYYIRKHWLADFCQMFAMTLLVAVKNAMRHPRTGDRMQATAQAVGQRSILTKPREVGRNAA